jgi:hypothetical protein
MNFLENCFQAPTLKSDKLLCKFVTDELPLVHYMPAFNQNLKPKNISEFLTPNGSVTTEASPEAIRFCK